MSQLQLFFELGLKHVLDFNGYDHILFLIVLVVSYTFNDWRKVLGLVTFFTIGHTVSLVLSSYDIVNFNSAAIEFLIPISILVTAIYNMSNAEKTTNKSNWVLLVATLFFGVIHGLGFSTYFKMMASGGEKVTSLLGFALGIEVAQVIIVCVVLILGFIIQRMLNVSRQLWILISSSIVIGIVLTILKETWPF